MVGVGLLGAVGFGVQLVAISLAGEVSPGESATVTLRRDPVRALAEAQGVSALAPAPALALASTQDESVESSEEASVESERSVAGPTSP